MRCFIQGCIMLDSFTLLLLWNKEHAFIFSADTIFEKGDDEMKDMSEHGFYRSEN